MGAVGTRSTSSLDRPGATSTAWSLPVTISGNRQMQVLARTVGLNGTNDSSKAMKKFETFGLADQTPNTAITGPSGRDPDARRSPSPAPRPTTSGSTSISYSIRDAQNRYLQDDGSTSGAYNTFRGAARRDRCDERDLVVRGRPCPTRASGPMQATAVDTAGQSDLRSADRSWIVSATAIAPTVADHRTGDRQPADRHGADHRGAGRPVTFTGLGDRRRGPQERRDHAAEPDDPREPGDRRHLGRRRHRRLVPDLADQHLRYELQLVLHDTVQPDAGHLRLRGAGHRRSRPDHLVGERARLTINVQVPGDCRTRRPPRRHRHDHRAAGRCSST